MKWSTWNRPRTTNTTYTKASSLLHKAESFLISRSFLRELRNSPHIMEPDGWLPCSQEPVIYPSSKQNTSRPHHPTLFFHAYLNTIFHSMPTFSKHVRFLIKAPDGCDMQHSYPCYFNPSKEYSYYGIGGWVDHTAKDTMEKTKNPLSMTGIEFRFPSNRIHSLLIKLTEPSWLLKLY